MDLNDVIIGEQSEMGKIRIDSNDFASIATYDEEKNQVTVEVDLHENIKPDVDERDWKFYLWFAACIFFANASLMGYIASVVIVNPILANGLALLSIIVFSCVMYSMLSRVVRSTITIYKLFWEMRKVAPWHGAEHKVIDSYCQNGTTDLEAAKLVSPISDYCGGRFAVLYLLAMGALLAVAIAFALGDYKTIGIVISSIILATLVMILFHRTTMKCAVHLSRKLQKYWTIKEPGEKELWTAHCAIVELLKTEKRYKNLENFQKYSITYDRRP
ncbi:MAG: DUF1385 domain-containing protein [Patescibacteria group bacterium]